MSAMMAGTVRNRHFDARKPSREGKLPVAEPTTVGKFFLILLMHVCRKILFIDTSYKAGLYLCAVTVGSVITDLVPVPKTYLAYSHNFFNVYFVKFAWGWTFTLLSSFIYLTATIYCIRDKKLLKKHFMRMIVGTVIWFVCTSFFNYIENLTGDCSEPGATDKLSCRKLSGTWLGFDISGHAFLLTYCLLMISEEVKCLKGWEKIVELPRKEGENPTGRYTEDQRNRIEEDLSNFTAYIKGLTVALTVLLLLWEVMLASTILYFHNMPQKLAGTVFAVAMWFLTYILIFPSSKNVPSPGYGLVRYRKDG